MKSAPFRLLVVQLLLLVLLAAAVVYGLLGLALGWREDGVAVVANIFWATYDMLLLSVVIRALLFVRSEDNTAEGINRLGLPTLQRV